MPAILGRKLGMTQVFDAAGNLVPVTVVEAGPCVVVGVRTPDREGYAAVQLGFEPLAERRTSKPLRGVFAKKGLPPMRIIREVRLAPGEAYEVGQQVRVDVFAGGDRVHVTGIRKGKRMPGRMGGQRTTVRGLQVVAVDAERNVLLIKGAVPGGRGALLLVRRAQEVRA